MASLGAWTLGMMGGMVERSGERRHISQLARDKKKRGWNGRTMKPF